MTENTDASMAGKTVVVKGSTGGIGKATAIGLARLGARVGETKRSNPASYDTRAAARLWRESAALVGLTTVG